MSLSTSSSSGAQNGSVSDEDVDKDLDAAKPQQRSSNRTVERAVALLQELRPSLLAEIAKLSHFPASASSGSLTSDTSSRGPLLATFRSVGMFEDSWNAKKRRKGHGGAVEASDCARVMFAKPQEDADEHGQTLRRISDIISARFTQEGLLRDAKPAYLHATLINASRRKPPRKGGSFSFFAVHDAIKSRPSPFYLAGGDDAAPDDDDAFSEDSPPDERDEVFGFDFGEPVPIESVEIWEMGSRDANGCYVSCGGISLV